MTRLAILDEVLPTQIDLRTDDLSPVEVVWTGTDPARLLADAARLRPNVLALNFDLLGGEDHAARRAKELAEATGAELVILLYQFARREVLREMARTGARPVKVPVTVTNLRTHMTSVIVKQLLAPPGAEPGSAQLAQSAPTERRFTKQQLARLREIESKVECECPNHLSELLLSLNAFEDYSAACENRNADDARIHSVLHRSTAAARRIVEDALVELLRHENIVL